MSHDIEVFLEKLKYSFDSCNDLEYVIPDYDELYKELIILIESYNDEDDV